MLIILNTDCEFLFYICDQTPLNSFDSYDCDDGDFEVEPKFRSSRKKVIIAKVDLTREEKFSSRTKNLEVCDDETSDEFDDDDDGDQRMKQRTKVKVSSKIKSKSKSRETKTKKTPKSAPSPKHHNNHNHKRTSQSNSQTRQTKFPQFVSSSDSDFD